MSNTQPPLSDSPIVEPIVVFHNSIWVRSFRILNRTTREERDITNISFYGNIGYQGSIVASFQFTKALNNLDFEVRLPISAINVLDPSLVYDYDWILVEDCPEIFATGQLFKRGTVTVPIFDPALCGNTSASE